MRSTTDLFLNSLNPDKIVPLTFLHIGRYRGNRNTTREDKAVDAFETSCIWKYYGKWSIC